MSTESRLGRFRSFVPDFDRFAAVAATPEPTHVRIRTGRRDPRSVVASLEDKGFRPEPLEGLEGVYVLREEPYSVAHTLEHWEGLLYIQQAVTAVAAAALGVRPGERVLDIAAAPGGKTTHLADLMEDRGCLVANDRAEKRLQALLANVYRTSHSGIAVMSGDGRTLPGEGLFDRVLADVPCSGEGNVRSREGDPGSPKARYLERITRVQERLLRRALGLVRPGGEVLYVTCTFNPAENEAVVDRVLRGGGASVAPIGLDLPHAPGLTSWEGHTFHPDLEAAWRLYPYHLDSGGLFLARLVREGEGRCAEEGWKPVPGGYGPDDREGAEERAAAARKTLREEYGVVGEVLEGLRWMVRGDSIWATRADAWCPTLWSGRGRRLVALGLRAMKLDGRTGTDRPTNDFLAWLGSRLGRGVVDVDRPALLRALDGERIPLGTPDGSTERAEGFIVLRVDGRVAGRAFARGGVLLHHEIPRARAEQLRRVVEVEARGRPRGR